MNGVNVPARRVHQSLPPGRRSRATPSRLLAAVAESRAEVRS
jgi:hypothetical protein